MVKKGKVKKAMVLDENRFYVVALTSVKDYSKREVEKSEDKTGALSHIAEGPTMSQKGL